MFNSVRSMIGAVTLAAAVTIGMMGFTTSNASAMHGRSHAHSSHGKHSFRHVGKHRFASHHHKHWHRWHHRHHRYAWRHWHYRNGYVSSGSAGYVAPSYAASTPAPASCNCLTKEYLPDGSVLFKDLCTKEQASASDGSSPVARGPSPSRN